MRKILAMGVLVVACGGRVGDGVEAVEPVELEGGAGACGETCEAVRGGDQSVSPGRNIRVEGAVITPNTVTDPCEALAIGTTCFYSPDGQTITRIWQTGGDFALRFGSGQCPE